MILPRSDVVAGASVHIALIAGALLDRGHDCRVFVGGSGPYLDYLHRRSVPAEPVPALDRPIRPHRDVVALVDLSRRLHRYRPDVIAAHTAKAGVLARLIGRRDRVPVAYTPHGWAFLDGVPAGPARRYLAIERLSARLGGPTVVVSEYERVFGIATRIAPASELITIRNGIPDIPADRRATPAHGPARLVMVARFDEQKDHDLLLRALARLDHLDWSLTLVGSGGRRAEVERLAATLRIADRIDLTGESDDVPAHLARSQIFALISRWESYPLSVLEAMRAGLPIVASDVGGMREIVEPARTGFLIPRGDDEELTRVLAELIGDASLRARLGAAARADYESRHTVESMIDRTIALYDSVAAGAARPPTPPVAGGGLSPQVQPVLRQPQR